MRLTPINHGLTHHSSETVAEKISPKTYEGDHTALTTPQRRWLIQKFPWLSLAAIRINQFMFSEKYQELLIPLYHPCLRVQVGTLLRFYEQMPKTTTDTAQIAKQKSYTYWEQAAAENYSARVCMPLSSLKLAVAPIRVAVVEDYMSAVRLGQYMPTIPLLGTNLNIGVLTCLSGNDTVFCLDGDATAKSVALTQKYGLLFRSAMTIDLGDGADIKDMGDEEFSSFLIAKLDITTPPEGGMCG